MTDIHIVINPASGARKTESIWEEEVRPLLEKHSSSLRIVEHRTESEGDGARIGKEIVDGSAGDKEMITIVLLGGDGTTHEVLNGIVKQKDGKCEIPARVRLALVPTGTANALYASLYPGEEVVDSQAYRTKNVQALLSASTDSQDDNGYPLALTNVTTDNGKNTIAHLITSHALHASILADSEALRSTHPGIERFKIASAQNVTRWTSARVKLQGRGDKGDQIQLYDADSKSFKDILISEANLDGPILYFVCVTTDRLEPTFVPAPLSGPSAPSPSQDTQRPSDAVDILLIRPLRDPTLESNTKREASFWSDGESKTLREDFASKRIQPIVGGMYDKGRHIDMHYDETGPLICEYYRCAGYEWTPLDDRARRTCIDGTVLESSLTTVRVLTQEEGAGRITVCK